MKKILQCAVVIVSLLFTISQAFARAGQNSDEWQFSLSPLFLWGMNIDGYSQIGPKVAPLELDFTDDVFENLAAVFTVHFEANKNDLALFGEYQYVKLEPSTSISNGPTIDVDFTIQAAEFGAGYRVVTWGNTDVEPIIGARWAYQDLEVNTRNGGLNLVDSNESWWDIFGGVRLWTHFNEKWTLISRADIGAGGSNFVWNASFIVDYQFRDWGSVFDGYRWMNYDYDNGAKKIRIL